MRTIKFYTLGCKVNQYDTQAIREQFLGAGFHELENSCPADAYIINTCTVTHRADAESLNLIRRAKRENPGAKILVTGCLAQLDEGLIRSAENKSIIVKNKDKNRILDFLNEPHGRNGYGLNVAGIKNFSGHTRAFLKIQDGCDNFCSYCKVPLVRGASKSKDSGRIIQEARQLVRSGFKEIVLSGICLGSYGKDSRPRIDLVDLIQALLDLEGLFRLRLSSIEMLDISDRLLDTILESKVLCRHLHIPLQSGSDAILKKMRRNYSRMDYLCLIKKIKDKVPGIAITTDCLVGFPGESQTDFKDTLDLIRKILPLKVHIFPYSPRKGTSAFNFKEKLNPAIIKKRTLLLKNVADACALTYKKQFLGKYLDVLVEEPCHDCSDLWQGYTDNYIKVRLKSKLHLKNKILPVKIKKVILGLCPVGLLFTGQFLSAII